MTSLMSFEFESITISSFVDEKGRDWFRGTEVCKILQIANPAVVIKREAAEYWTELQVGHGRPALYVSEPGLYALIFASKSPNAKRFQQWVFESVLPQVRQKGFYATDEVKEALGKAAQAMRDFGQYVDRHRPHYNSEAGILETMDEAHMFYLGSAVQQSADDLTKLIDSEVIAT